MLHSHCKKVVVNAGLGWVPNAPALGLLVSVGAWLVRSPLEACVKELGEAGGARGDRAGWDGRAQPFPGAGCRRFACGRYSSGRRFFFLLKAKVKHGTGWRGRACSFLVFISIFGGLALLGRHVGLVAKLGGYSGAWRPLPQLGLCLILPFLPLLSAFGS